MGVCMTGSETGMLCSGLVVGLESSGGVRGVSLVDLPWSTSGHGFVFPGLRRIRQVALFLFLLSLGGSRWPAHWLFWAK